MKAKSFRWALVLSALGWSASADAQGLIQGINAHKSGAGAEIQILGKDLAMPKLIKAFGGRQYILEFNADTSHKDYLRLGYGSVKSVGVNWHGHMPVKVWVVIRLEDASTPSLIPIPDGWLVQVNTGEVLGASVHTGANPQNSGFKVLPKTVLPKKEAPDTVNAIPVLPVAKPETDDAGVSPITVVAPSSGEKIKPSTASKLHPSTAISIAEPVLSLHLGSAALTSKSATHLAAQPIDQTPEPAVPKRRKKHAPKKSELPELAPLTSKKTVLAESSSPSYSPASHSGDVSMDFTDTEVSTVLRAVAMQTHESIVVTPDVTGKISITLDHVSIKEALDTITAAADCRYAKVGNTYFVAPGSKFNGLMQQFRGADLEQEIRILPTYSGRGGQISLAVERAIPNNGALNYTIVLPSENVTAKTEGSKGGGAGTAGGAQGSGGQGSSGGGQSSGGGGASGGSTKGTSAQSVQATDYPGHDTYIIVVGPRDTLDTVEAMAKKMDRDLCIQMGVDYPETWEIATATYHCQANSAQTLLASICETDRVTELKAQPLRTTYGRVDMFATSNNPNVDQKLFLRGPKQEVDRLLSLLQGLDDTGGENATVEVYNVKFSDPRALKEDLLVQVPGLRVSVPAASVSSPQSYKSKAAITDAQQQGVASTGSQTVSKDSGGSSSSSSDSSKSTDSLPGSGGDKSDQEGLGLPFTQMESNTVPMRLVLKGTASQIEQAKRYLQAIDTAPKQVAIELRVMELSKEDAINAGVNWNLFTGGAVKFINLNNTQSTATNNSVTVGLNKWGINGDVIGQLDKIANRNNLIARPNLLATDGRQSEVFIGDAVRYVESIISSQNGVTVTTGTVRVGVRMAILPRVGSDGNITMELRPLVSFLKGFTQVTQIGGQLPQTSERVAQSTLTIKSGETIAIGGLIQDQDTKDAKGLPILMDLPLLGNLFKRTTNTRDRTELVIFVTAREVDGPATSSNFTLPMNDPQPEKSKGKGK